MDKFATYLKGRIKFSPNNAKKLVKEISDPAVRYGYQYIIENCPTKKIVEPTDLHVEDSLQTTIYSDKINLLERFSNSSLKAARKYAHVI